MAITPTLKGARGYERSGFQRFQEIAEGERPALGQVAKVADFLPVKVKDEYFNEYWVLFAGTILSMDKTLQGVNRIVPANGNAAQAIVYGTADVGIAVDVDTYPDATLVATAHSASATIPANKPVGWAWHNMYNSAVEKRLINYELQPFVSVLCDYEIEVPLIDLIAGVQNFVPGSLVKPGCTGTEQGLPHLWVNGVDSAEQICGRILYRDTIPFGTNSRARIDLQKPVRGLGLSGVENEGRPRHLDVYQIAAPTTRATDFVRINITLL